MESGIAPASGSLVKPLTIVTRREWGASRAKYPGLEKAYYPALNVFLRYYSGNETCNDDEECRKVMRMIQKTHQREFVDITHNFLIARDGTVYEGRGWAIKSQSPDYDITKLRIKEERTLTLAYIGNFEAAEPTPEMSQTVKDLIAFGIKHKYIEERHQFYEVSEVK